MGFQNIASSYELIGEEMGFFAFQTYRREINATFKCLREDSLQKS